MNARTKILVVDDFAAMRQLINSQLRELGFRDIELADDGSTALPILRSGAVDFLITDLNMPVMTGIELIRTLRADPALCDLPVLIVTAEARREQIMAAAELGVTAYIVKPFTRQVLGSKVAEVLERHSQPA